MRAYPKLLREVLYRQVCRQGQFSGSERVGDDPDRGRRRSDGAADETAIHVDYRFYCAVEKKIRADLRGEAGEEREGEGLTGMSSPPKHTPLTFRCR